MLKISTSIIPATICFLLVFLAPAFAEIQMYSNDFEGPGPVGSEWSNTSTDTTPGTVPHPADKFLGQFGNQDVTLTINNLPLDHTELRIEFDLYVIRSWDGNFDQDARGPDYWAMDEGTIPVNPEDWDYITTFSNWEPGVGPNQAYPDIFGVGDHNARTGADENNTLGFLFDPGSGDIILDAVYHGDVLYSHTAGTFIVTFGADHLQALDDESWGIDNVNVYLDVPEPSTLALLTAGLLLLKRKRSA